MTARRFPLLHAGLVAVTLTAGCGTKTDPSPAGSSSGKAGPNTPAIVSAKPDVPAPTGTAVLRGVVKFDGSAPSPEPWGGIVDPECKPLHPDTIQLVRVTDGKLADVFVRVSAGLPKGTYPVPKEPVAIDQKSCEFVPRVFGMMAGQPLTAGNGDRLLHTIGSPEFDQGIAFGTRRTLTLNQPGVMVPFKCDLHPWMHAYVGLTEHPYFAVTKEDGAFEIKGLVDGEYTLEAWHEKLGRLEAHGKAPGDAVEITYSTKTPRRP